MVKQEEDTEGYKVIGWIFLILAVTLLLNAIILNPRKSQLGLVLFIFGDILLVLGATIAYLTGGKRKMAEEKLTVKKGLLIVVLTAIAVVPACALYFAIFIFSLPFTANATVSWILSLSITLGIPIVLFIASERRKKKCVKNSLSVS